MEGQGLQPGVAIQRRLGFLDLERRFQVIEAQDLKTTTEDLTDFLQLFGIASSEENLPFFHVYLSISLRFFR
jgi:hypothetical protein